MKRHILYLAMLALGTAATGCSDDDTAKEGRTEPTTVESISIRTQMAEVSRAQTGDDDPTMGPASTRAGHTMTVTLGSGSERMQATYEYDGGKWIPAGEAVVFPDNKRQPVGIILRKEGTAIQDGTAQGLIDADQLGWDNPAQVPLREMANVPMRHLKTMVEFELGTIAATALTASKPATSGTATNGRRSSSRRHPGSGFRSRSTTPSARRRSARRHPPPTGCSWPITATRYHWY